MHSTAQRSVQQVGGAQYSTAKCVAGSKMDGAFDLISDLWRVAVAAEAEGYRISVLEQIIGC